MPDDARYRSRKFLLAAFVELFASVIVVAIGVANGFALVVAGMTAPPIMPALWWWSSVSAGVLSLYGATDVLNNMAQRESGK